MQLLSRNNPPACVNSPRTRVLFFSSAPPARTRSSSTKATFIKGLTQKASPLAACGTCAYTSFKLMTYIHNVIWIIRPAEFMYKSFITSDWKGIWSPPHTLILQIITIKSKSTVNLFMKYLTQHPFIPPIRISTDKCCGTARSSYNSSPLQPPQNDPQGMWDTHIVQDCKESLPWPCLIIYCRPWTHKVSTYPPHTIIRQNHILYMSPWHIWVQPDLIIKCGHITNNFQWNFCRIIRKPFEVWMTSFWVEIRESKVSYKNCNKWLSSSKFKVLFTFLRPFHTLNLLIWIV